MDSQFQIFLEIPPVPKGRPRMTKRGHVYTPAATRAYENAVSVALQCACKEPMTEPLCVSLDFWLPTPKTVTRPYPSVRPDIDNLAKAILDAANGVLWADDSLICKLTLCKDYAVGRRVGINIVAYEL